MLNYLDPVPSLSQLKLERARCNFELWYGGVPRLVLERPATGPEDESMDNVIAREAIHTPSIEQVRMSMSGRGGFDRCMGVTITMHWWKNPCVLLTYDDGVRGICMDLK